MKVEEILYHPAFLKEYKKLDPALAELVAVAEDLFRENPLAASLGLHKLGGKLKVVWAISVNYKIRITFIPWKPAGTVVFLSVGPHDLYNAIHRRLRSM